MAAPRSMWNGTVAVGDVVFPVKLYSIVAERRVRFREVHLADGGRIVHRRFGSDSGEEVPAERIRKAYEISDGQQVVLAEEEIAAARGPNTKVIQIEHFVAAGEIDPLFYDRPYVLGAQPGGEHAYRVLHAALERSGRVGIGRFMLRTREQLVALGVHGHALRLYTMRFADEIVASGDLDIPALSRAPTDRELEMARRLVETLAQPWEPERYEDRHRQAVLALIEQKAAGEELRVPEVSEPAETPDLLAALEASLAARPRRRAPSPTGAGRRRSPASPRAGGGTGRSSRARSH
ncbi:MAG TPA: Ku protein [Solirubrobacteraceae bacterium]|nr:Ku protein [Solirubrobacteraceae bacterium]